jgi:hypothetical protein
VWAVLDLHVLFLVELVGDFAGYLYLIGGRVSLAITVLTNWRQISSGWFLGLCGGIIGDVFRGSWGFFNCVCRVDSGIALGGGFSSYAARWRSAGPSSLSPKTVI